MQLTLLEQEGEEVTTTDLDLAPIDEEQVLGDKTHFRSVTCRGHHAICGESDLTRDPAGYDVAVTCTPCVEVAETGDRCLGCGSALPPAVTR